MHYLSVADVHCHMVDTAAVSVEEQVSRFRFIGVDSCPISRLRTGGMRQINAVFLINLHGKPGTVHTVGKACTAPDIPVSYKLTRILNHVYADIRNTFSIADLRHGHRLGKLFGKLYKLSCHIAFVAVRRV